MRTLTFSLLLAGSCFASPIVQNQPGYENGERPVIPYEGASGRAEAVKDAFRTAWDGYYTYAFPNDELKPETNSFGNSRLVNVRKCDCNLI